MWVGWKSQAKPLVFIIRRGVQEVDEKDATPGGGRGLWVTSERWGIKDFRLVEWNMSRFSTVLYFCEYRDIAEREQFIMRDISFKTSNSIIIFPIMTVIIIIIVIVIVLDRAMCTRHIHMYIYIDQVVWQCERRVWDSKLQNVSLYGFCLCLPPAFIYSLLMCGDCDKNNPLADGDGNRS